MIETGCTEMMKADFEGGRLLFWDFFDSPAALRHPLKRGTRLPRPSGTSSQRGTGILLWGDYLILSVDLTFLMSFFKAEAAKMVISKAAKGKATPTLNEGVTIVGSTDWAILGIMK